MSDKSNNQGRAYEFVCLLSLGEEIGKFRPVNIVQNSSYLAAEYAWNTLSPEMKNIYKVSSYTAVIQIFELIKKIRKTGVTVLLIEQNANLALRIADRGYVLETGSVKLTDSAKNLLKNGEGFWGFIDWTDGLNKQSAMQGVYIYCASLVQ